MSNQIVSKILLQSVRYLADRGFHAETIARATGLTKSQVYYRTGQLNIQLRSYRDGSSSTAKLYLSDTPCVKVSVKAKRGEMYKVAGLLSDG